MSLYNTKEYSDMLPIFLNNYNSLVHTTTGYAPIDARNNTAIHHIIAKRIRKKGEAGITTTQKKLQVGDYVRISLYAIDANKRSLISKGFAKKFKPNWSKDLYIIESVSQPTNPLGSEIY